MSGDRLAWWYQDRKGRWLFQHVRYPKTATKRDPRTKGYCYRYPSEIVNGQVQTWTYGKPAGADSIIYRLPLVLANRDARLVLCEGERDADELLRRGKLASCHHGGA